MSNPRDQKLAEWLKKMGCPLELSEEQLASLNAPNMRPVWKHIVEHVRPAHEVQLIRKNLLLARLKRQSKTSQDKTSQQNKTVHQLHQISNTRVETVQQLIDLNHITERQQEIEHIKAKLDELNKTLQSEIETHFTLKRDVENTVKTVQETEKKNGLLNLKRKKTSSDIIKLEEDIEDITLLIVEQSKTYHEKKRQVYHVADLLTNTKIPSLESSESIASEIVIQNLVDETKHLSADVIYRGVLLALKKLYDNLKQFRLKLNLPENNNSLRKHLKDFRMKIIKNEINLLQLRKETENQMDNLNMEKECLSKIIDDVCQQHNTSFENTHGESISAMQFLSAMITDTITKTKRENIKKYIQELEDECSDFKSKECEVQSSIVKENELRAELELKANEIKSLYFFINSKEVKELRLITLEDCHKLVFDFLNELKRSNCFEEDIFVALSDLMWNEVEVFVRTPLIALSRKWEDKPDSLVNKDLLPTNPKLFSFLLQSEPKNILKNVLEKKYFALQLEKWKV